MGGAVRVGAVEGGEHAVVGGEFVVVAGVAAPVGAAQTVRASRDAPSRRKSVASLVSCVSRPFEPP